MSRRIKKDVRRGRLEEERVSEIMGSRATPNSGAGDTKGDSRIHGVVRVENKHTLKDWYTLSAIEWEKLWTQAIKAGEEAVFVVNMLSTSGVRHVRVCVLSFNYAQMLFPHLEEPDSTVSKYRRLRVADAREGCSFRMALRHARKPSHPCALVLWSDYVEKQEAW